jgi:predicted phosphodiesterase
MLFLHISDIHFRENESGQPDDPNRGLRNDMIRDVRAMRRRIGKPADAILISGDIAAAGKRSEYEIASEWLEQKLCAEAGCTIENVFVIPGNHDIDRSSEIGPAQTSARASLRATSRQSVEAELRKWMRDRVSSDVIFGPIRNYNIFAARFLCALGPYEEGKPTRPFVVREAKLNDGSTLRIWGFNSVLVSDASDAEGNMLVDPAGAQIEAEDGVTNLVLCHHPFNWLKNGRAFEDRINAVAHLQLFGHEHTRRVEKNERFVRIRAGALQPARDEPDWKPGYNWIEISVREESNERSLQVRIWVRMHDESRFISVPDYSDVEVWESHFPLQPWKRPHSPASEKPVEQEANANREVDQIPEGSMTPTTPVISLRSVTVKMFKLKEHEQMRVIAEMNLLRAGDEDLKDYEIAISAVRRSEIDGSLEELDRLVDQALQKGKQG